jgi:glutathione S-transferase
MLSLAMFAGLCATLIHWLSPVHRPMDLIVAPTVSTIFGGLIIALWRRPWWLQGIVRVALVRRQVQCLTGMDGSDGAMACAGSRRWVDAVSIRVGPDRRMGETTGKVPMAKTVPDHGDCPWRPASPAHDLLPARNPTMTITITAFEKSPDGGKGLARDTRVRWALEEAGQPYEVRLVSFQAMKEPAHLALHPFGQIPTYEEAGLALFESGAIVFHIAERHAGLLPVDADARARAIAWMFAALNTVEPPILELVTVRILEGDKPWAQARLPLVAARIRSRLDQLSARLGDAEWLDGGFSAGDLLMVSVLLRLRPSGMLNDFPGLAAYVARGEARPAYKRAYAAQAAVAEKGVRDSV